MCDAVNERIFARLFVVGRRSETFATSDRDVQQVRPECRGACAGAGHIGFHDWAALMSASVLIVEDKDAIARRLAKMVESDGGLRLVGCAATVPDGLKCLQAERPDIVLVDLGLPGGSGLDIIKACNKASWTCRTVVLSIFGDEERVLSAIKQGASGYLQKGTSPEELLRGIKSVLQGGAPISPQIARHVLQELVRPSEAPKPAAKHSNLTKRELEVLQGLSRGYKRKEVAEQYGISVATVSNHISNIFRKLEVNSNTSAISKAGRIGLL